MTKTEYNLTATRGSIINIRRIVQALQEELQGLTALEQSLEDQMNEENKVLEEVGGV